MRATRIIHTHKRSLTPFIPPMLGLKVLQGGAAIAASRAPLHAPPAAASAASRALALLLPSGYPASVAPTYARYSAWASAATVFSSTAGVLATQSLLFALGVGAGVAVPASAAWQWVCKDGLGQLGGVLYAAVVGDRFDADPKRWRLAAALASDAAGALEVSMALAPGAVPFLPLAAVSNVGRNVSWLSASATRASLHQALAVRGNLADVTAKAGSQITAAATAGTALGVALSPFLGGAPETALALYGALSAAHLCAVGMSLRAVALPTLSDVRLRLACGALPTLPAADALRHAYLSPRDASGLEAFLPWQRNEDALRPSPSASTDFVVAPSLDDVPAFADFARASGAVDSRDVETGALPRAAYVVAVPPASTALSSRRRIQLLLHVDAAWSDVLIGHLHAQRVAALLQGGDVGGLQAVRDAREWVALVGPSYLAGLEAAGWWTHAPLLERGSDVSTRRYAFAE